MEHDADVRRSATVRAKNQLTLPPEIRSHLHVKEGDEVEFTVTESGEVVLRGMTRVPADQQWFWTQGWQAGEAAATAEIASGELATFGDADEMFGALER